VERERALDQLPCFDHLRLLPERAVLVIEQDELAVSEPCLTTRVV